VRRRRITLAAVCVVVVVLAAAAAAFAAATRDTSTVVASRNGATWMFKLRGIMPGSKMREMTLRDFAAFKATHSLEWTDPVSGDKYSGVGLRDLVGLIDDGNPAAFNTAMATNNGGYTVKVIGLDDFAYYFKSSDVATAGILVADKVMPSGATTWQQLPLGTVSSKTGPPESARWQPVWPMKLAGSFVAASGKMRIGGISIIQVMTTPPAN
jgi:hypothetical protein